MRTDADVCSRVLTYAQVSEILEDAMSMPARVETEGIQILAKRVSLQVAYKVQQDPPSARVLALRQTLLIVLSLLVLAGMWRAKSKALLPAASAWLRGDAAESCWPVLHEGIGELQQSVTQLHVSAHALCCSLCMPCIRCSGGGGGACGDASAASDGVAMHNLARRTSGSADERGTHSLSRLQTEPVRADRDAAAAAAGGGGGGGAGRHLDAITGARLLASLHVAATHLARLRPPAAPSIYFFQWGFTWVPWFFMLSGYILTYAQVPALLLGAEVLTLIYYMH